MSSARHISAFVVAVIAVVVSQADLGQANEIKWDENSRGMLALQEPRFRRSPSIGSFPGGRPLVDDLKTMSSFSSSSLSAPSLNSRRPTRSLKDASAAAVSLDLLTPTERNVRGSLLHIVLRRAVQTHSQGQGQDWNEGQRRRPRRSLRPWSLYALTPYAAKQPSYELPSLAMQPWVRQGTSWGRGFYPPSTASSPAGRESWRETEGPVESDDVGSSAWEGPYYQQQQAPVSSRRFMAWGRHGSFMLG